MEGVITVKETRSNLTGMQQIRSQEAQKIANALSTEQIIDNVANGITFVVNTVGTVMNVVTKFIPLPGEIDDIAVAIAQPALVGAVEAARNFFKGILVNHDREQIQASITDLAGNVQNITIRDTNLNQMVEQRRAQKKNPHNATVVRGSGQGNMRDRELYQEKENGGMKI